MQILESFRNIFAIPDLRKRVLFTFGLLAIYRIGSHIPTPGLDASALEEFFKASAGGLLGIPTPIQPEVDRLFANSHELAHARRQRDRPLPLLRLDV